MKPAASETILQGTLRTVAPVLTRENFRFSPGGTAGACIAGDGQGGRHLEMWSFAGPSPRWWPLRMTGAVTRRMQPVPLDDGRVLLCRKRVRSTAADGEGADVHEIVLLEQIAGCAETGRNALDAGERVLGVIQSDELVSLRLLPGPGADPVRGSRTPDEVLGMPPLPLAVAIGIDTRVCSVIWRLVADPPHLERLAEIPGAILGGAWLDSTGRFLGVDQVEAADSPAKTVAVDLRDGSWTPLLSVSKGSNDRLLVCHPRSGLLLVSTDASGEERIGWGRLDSDQPVRFPETLHRPGHPVAYPLAFDQDGQRVLLHADEGACSSLAVYTPATDHLAPVEIPPGVVHGLAYWAGDELRIPFSTPCQPPGVGILRTGDEPSWSVTGSAAAPAEMPWADAHIERLDGPAGPIEAIVYGGEGWLTSSRLLLALHGGPVDAWRFTFDPLFQRLVAAGIAVVALNQRGSSGYGNTHIQALRGAWGGPDLDDVCCIARALDTERRALGAPRLMLLGESYGAFLALLATSFEPDLWSRCVTLAPFLSGPRLYEEAPAIRGLIEQLAGCEELTDDLGPRDVLRLCHSLQAKLLIVHGERDEMIPVTQSRVLRQRLLTLGRREGVDFEYLEVPDGGHDLATGVHTEALHARVVRFLATGALKNAPSPTAWEGLTHSIAARKQEEVGCL